MKNTEINNLSENVELQIENLKKKCKENNIDDINTLSGKINNLTKSKILSTIKAIDHAIDIVINYNPKKSVVFNSKIKNYVAI